METIPLSTRLADLATAFCDRTITDAESVDLEQLLSSSPADLRAFVRFMDLHGFLLSHAMGNGGAGNDAMVDALLGPAVEAIITEPVLTDIQVERSSAIRSPRPSQQERPWFASSWASACAVALLFYGSFGVLAWNLRPSATIGSRGTPSEAVAQKVNEIRPEASTRNEKARNAPHSANRYVATLTDTSDCLWQSTGSGNVPTIGNKLPAGESLFLDRGAASIAFAGGAKVNIEGPTHIQIEHAGRIYLRRGKLVAHVPRRAVGFTVGAPSGEIVDLGTEFGVDVDPTGNVNVAVFKGRVSVQPANGQRQAFSERQSVRIENGQIKPITSVDEQFARLRSGIDHDIDLAVDDPELMLDWNNPLCWSGGAEVTSRGHYHVGRSEAKRLRTPENGLPDAFRGGVLTIHATGELAPKHKGVASIPDLRLDGGSIYLWHGFQTKKDMALGGTIRVLTPSRVELNGCTFSLAAKLEGPGELAAIGPGTLRLNTDSQRFAGNWRIDKAHLVAATLGSLGSGNVTVLAEGKFEPQYDVDSPQASVVLEAGASMVVNRRLTFGEVTVGNQRLPASSYPIAELAKRHPRFFEGANGTLTIAAATDQPTGEQVSIPSPLEKEK